MAGGDALPVQLLRVVPQAEAVMQLDDKDIAIVCLALLGVAQIIFGDASVAREAMIAIAGLATGRMTK